MPVKTRLKPVRTISIGTLAERTGIAVSAIRYYEEQGLLHPERNAGGHRRFLRSDIRRLSFILISQQFGFSLGDIRREMEHLPARRTPTKRDWAHIGKTLGQALDQKIAALTEMRDRLDGCIGCGCLSLTACKLYNPEDRAAKFGTGPRYLLGDKPQG